MQITRELTPEETKQVQAGMFEQLCAIRDICDAEGIWYCLAFGSMLGAVREKGFIPWDNDVDIYVKASDKDRLRDAFDRRHPKGLVMKKYGVDRKFTKSHDKIVFAQNEIDFDTHLDIYYIFGAPSERSKQARFAKMNFFLDNVLRCKYNPLKYSTPKNKPFVFVCKIFDFFIPDSLIARIFQSRENKYDFCSSEYFTSITGDPVAENCFPKRLVENSVDVEFNGQLFKIPSDWNLYLTQVFGSDYMTPKRY